MDNWRQSKFTFLELQLAQVDARPKFDDRVQSAAGTSTHGLGLGSQRPIGLLHYMLVPLLDGSAQRLLEHASDGEGLLSRHRLVSEHGGRRHCCSRSWHRPSKVTCEVRWCHRQGCPPHRVTRSGLAEGAHLDLTSCEFYGVQSEEDLPRQC